MYLSRVIKVNLTAENTEILRRPSKIFNKLKSVFSGEMTPMQKLRAEVMLSVLQRLNISLRAADFNNLVSIFANSESLYEGGQAAVDDLGQGEDALIKGLKNADIRALDSLSLTVDKKDGPLRYLLHAQVFRKPRKGATPLKLTVLGFIDEFMREGEETDEDYAKRVQKKIEKKWADKTQQKKKIGELERHFNRHVSKLQREINKLFPAQSALEDLKKVIRSEPMEMKHACHQARYSDVYSYLPLWYVFYSSETMLEEDGDKIDFEVEKGALWDLDESYALDDDASTWADNSYISDIVDGGASCSSGCGSGCGS